MCNPQVASEVREVRKGKEGTVVGDARARGTYHWIVINFRRVVERENEYL